jgi:hypothetical protein
VPSVAELMLQRAGIDLLAQPIAIIGVHGEEAANDRMDALRLEVFASQPSL